ncbi:MAG: CotH kinase family protein, partial [Planctomycetota bacterium]
MKRDGSRRGPGSTGRFRLPGSCLIAFGIVVGFALPLGAGEKDPAKKKEREKPQWDRIYPQDKLLDITLTIAKKDWERLPRRPFTYVPAGFSCGHVRIAKVGLRVKGNSSSSVPNQRKSFKIDFDRFEKDRRFHGVNKLNLHNGFKDPTMMREYLAYKIFREAGVPASHVGFARLFITIPGTCTKKYLGIYSNVEQVNGAFLRDRFGDNQGNLWKGEGGSEFQFVGKDPEVYGAYELKRNERRGDYSSLIEFIRIVNETKDDAFGKVIEKHLDVKAFLAYMAVNTILSNMDSPAGTGHNYYIYHDPRSDRFTVIPWDLNEAFGNFRMGSGRDMERMSIDEPYAGEKILIRRVLSVKRFLEAYRAILKKLISGPFSPAVMAREIDRVYHLIRKAVENDPLMSFSNEEFKRAIEEDIPGRGPGNRRGGVLGLKSFTRNRVASIKNQLSGREQGVKPSGRAFRGPPPSGGP